MQRNRIRRFSKAVLPPNRINAIRLIRFFIWQEQLHLPTFVSYRILLHIHGFKMGRRGRLGGDLFSPSPRRR